MKIFVNLRLVNIEKRNRKTNKWSGMLHPFIIKISKPVRCSTYLIKKDAASSIKFENIATRKYFISLGKPPISLTKRIRLVSIELIRVNMVSKKPNKVTDIESAFSAS